MMKKSALILVILVAIFIIGCAEKERKIPVSVMPAADTTSDVPAIQKNISVMGNWEGTYDIGVDVGAVCTNMKVMRYQGPISMELLQSRDKITGTGTISGVNNIFLTGTGECTPQTGGYFEMKITGNTRNDGSVIINMDFGDPDLYFPKLQFIGILDDKELSGMITGNGIAASSATLTKQ